MSSHQHMVFLRSSPLPRRPCEGSYSWYDCYARFHRSDRATSRRPSRLHGATRNCRNHGVMCRSPGSRAGDLNQFSPRLCTPFSSQSRAGSGATESERSRYCRELNKLNLRPRYPRASRVDRELAFLLSMGFLSLGITVMTGYSDQA